MNRRGFFCCLLGALVPIKSIPSGVFDLRSKPPKWVWEVEPVGVRVTTIKPEGWTPHGSWMAYHNGIHPTFRHIRRVSIRCDKIFS